QQKDKGAPLTLVFARTKYGSDKLTKKLRKKGLKVESIHGDKSQSARERALTAFRKKQIRVLVATDVAARGIDVKGITLVINFELPDEPESYVHRIGRTARAKAHGMALSFCSKEEFAKLKEIEKTIGSALPILREHSFHQEEWVAQYREFRDRKPGRKNRPKKPARRRNFRRNKKARR
ncbi:MAG: C-terminal helicase domain-containing protein, partial [Verrucomicrobiota bacterium]